MNATPAPVSSAMCFRSANGLGMVLAEKGTLDHAKDVFARVREVSAEVLGDVWINLAHVYLAQNKHNEVSFKDQHFYPKNSVVGSVVDKVAHHINATFGLLRFGPLVLLTHLDEFRLVSGARTLVLVSDLWFIFCAHVLESFFAKARTP